MRSIIPAVLAFGAVLLLATALRADEHSDKPSVSTTGEAVVYVKPDEVVLNFGVQTFDASLEKAKDLNDQASTRIVRAAKEAGVEEKFLQIDTMTVSLRYRDNGNPINGIEGYLTNRIYCATLKDVKKLDGVVNAVIKAGANQLNGIEFRSTEMRKHRDQARKMAIIAAKEKAELLAAALDVKVGAPRTITEGGSFIGYQSRLGFNVQNAGAAVPAAEGGDSDTTPLGQIAIHASVSVVFDIR